MAARRERLLAASSPAVRAKILGLPPAHEAECAAHRITVDLGAGLRTIERNVSSGQLERLRREVRALARQCEAVRGELGELREQHRRALEGGPPRGIADVAGCFVGHLARLGYRIEDDPVTLGHLLSERRALEWAQPRMVAMWLCVSIARKASFPTVGRYFERDHTTVKYAGRQIKRVLAELPVLRAAALATCATLEAEPPAALRT
jgi:hypothetical protein